MSEQGPGMIDCGVWMSCMASLHMSRVQGYPPEWTLLEGEHMENKSLKLFLLPVKLIQHFKENMVMTA